LTFDKFAERGFETVGGMAAQKLSVIGHLSYIQPQNARIGQKKLVRNRRAGYAPRSFNYGKTDSSRFGRA
jgi:hypothetical protein